MYVCCDVCVIYTVNIATCRDSSEGVDNFIELLVSQSSCGKPQCMLTANCSQTIYMEY